MKQILFSLLAVITISKVQAKELFSGHSEMPVGEMPGEVPIGDIGPIHIGGDLGRADDLIPIDGHDIHVCRPLEDKELARYINKALKRSLADASCGDIDSLRNELQTILVNIDDVAIGGTGYCFSKTNCRRPVVSAQKVTQAECKATLSGDSWQQDSPTLGSCINL